MMIAVQLGLALLMTAPAERAATGSPSPPADEQILQPDHRHLRGNQVALDFLGGSLGGRAVGQTFIVGGRVTYYPIRQLGIGAAYGFSRGIGGIETVNDRSVHYVHGQLELPLISALRVGRHKVVQMDLFGEVGAGAVYIAQHWQAMGAIGGGVRIYPGLSWLAVRVDAITFLHDTRRASGKAFDADVAFTLGLSFLLPPRPRPFHRRR